MCTCSWNIYSWNIYSWNALKRNVRALSIQPPKRTGNSGRELNTEHKFSIRGCPLFPKIPTGFFDWMVSARCPINWWTASCLFGLQKTMPNQPTRTLYLLYVTHNNINYLISTRLYTSFNIAGGVVHVSRRMHCCLQYILQWYLTNIK